MRQIAHNSSAFSALFTKNYTVPSAYCKNFSKILGYRRHRLVSPHLLMIRWSITGIWTIFPAEHIILVKCKSSVLGSELPEGWLWTRITDTARSSMAWTNVSLGCTKVWFTRPVVSSWILITTLEEFKVTRTMCSWFSYLR